MSIEMAIEDHGFESAGLVSTRSGALERCDSAPKPDAAIVDLDLADGPTGLKLVRDLDERGIPSIIVSGQAGSIDPDDVPSYAVIAKPFSDAQLIRTLEELFSEEPAYASR